VSDAFQMSVVTTDLCPNFNKIIQAGGPHYTQNSGTLDGGHYWFETTLNMD
jgi:hypothetical protein